MSTTYDADVLLGLQQAVLEKLVRRVDRKIILDNLCKVVEGAIPDTLCSIMELTGSGNLRVLAAPCVPKDLVSELNGLIPSALAASCGTAVFTSQTVIVEDTLTDPRWESMRKQAIQYGIKSCWSIPIFAGDGEVMGSFAISHLVHRTPDEIHLRLLEMGGCLVGLTLERDRDEAELRQKKTLLDNIIQSTEDPIFAKDLEGRYLIANEATALTAGTGPQEMVGRKDEEIFDPEIAAGFKATDKIVYDTGEAHHYEDVFHQPGAGDRRFLVCKTPLRSSTGAFSGIVGVARDVTELRRAEEAMLQTQKLESLGVLTGGIAHDFNNLLTGILGHAELARARSRGGPAESNLREIERAATQAADLVTQMLAYAGRAEAKKTKVDLASLVREVSSLIDSSVSKKTDLSFRFSDDLPAINADASQIRQVVMNLIINASEALNGATGRVDVDIQKYNKHLLLTVTDSGHGMDDETRGRIFDPFFSTKFTGRGLGLAAVQGIIRGHEGRIKVTSEPGLGTTFSVWLPTCDKNNCVEPIDELPQAKGRANVLVVDDEESIRCLMEDALESAGFHTVLVDDGTDAVELLEHTRTQFDLILLDLTTPRLAGRAAYDRMREILPDIPILLASGFDENEALREFEPGDLAGFLKKPFRPSALVETVREIVS